MMNDSTTLELDDYELNLKPLRYPIYFQLPFRKKVYLLHSIDPTGSYSFRERLDYVLNCNLQKSLIKKNFYKYCSASFSERFPLIGKSI